MLGLIYVYTAVSNMEGEEEKKTANNHWKNIFAQQMEVLVYLQLNSEL